MNVTAFRKSDPTAAARSKRYRRRHRHGSVTAAAPAPSRRHADLIVTGSVTIAALALAAVSGTFSIAGLTTIFAGQRLLTAAMGCAFEFAKLAAVAWLGRFAAPLRIRLPVMILIGALMAFNAIGAFGFLSRAHLGGTAQVDTRRDVQAQLVGDLDKRIAQVDAAVNETTRRGRTVTAMTLADRQATRRAELVMERQRQAQALATLQAAVTTDDGPLHYLAALTGIGADKLLHAFIATLALLLDPLAALLLLAAVSSRGRP